jgi:serine/threonine protein kinase
LRIRPLGRGAKLGPYEILEPLGAGGMGEVYNARDTRLNRSVAIEVSGAQFSDRFEREARAMAALNHPHICSLYDVGPNYLVMEYLEGSTLSDRLKNGPLKADQIREFAMQIMDGLEAAHFAGASAPIGFCSSPLKKRRHWLMQSF